MLMSFMGSKGKLMADSGLGDIFEQVYASKAVKAVAHDDGQDCGKGPPCPHFDALGINIAVDRNARRRWSQDKFNERMV